MSSGRPRLRRGAQVDRRRRRAASLDPADGRRLSSNVDEVKRNEDDVDDDKMVSELMEPPAKRNKKYKPAANVSSELHKLSGMCARASLQDVSNHTRLSLSISVNGAVTIPCKALSSPILPSHTSASLDAEPEEDTRLMTTSGAFALPLPRLPTLDTYDFEQPAVSKPVPAVARITARPMPDLWWAGEVCVPQMLTSTPAPRRTLPILSTRPSMRCAPTSEEDSASPQLPVWSHVPPVPTLTNSSSDESLISQISGSSSFMQRSRKEEARYADLYCVDDLAHLLENNVRVSENRKNSRRLAVAPLASSRAQSYGASSGFDGDTSSGDELVNPSSSSLTLRQKRTSQQGQTRHTSESKDLKIRRKRIHSIASTRLVTTEGTTDSTLKQKKRKQIASAASSTNALSESKSGLPVGNGNVIHETPRVANASASLDDFAVWTPAHKFDV